VEIYAQKKRSQDILDQSARRSPPASQRGNRDLSRQGLRRAIEKGTQRFRTGQGAGCRGDGKGRGLKNIATKTTIGEGLDGKKRHLDRIEKNNH